MRVLVAPDGFKGCLSAARVASALAQGCDQAGAQASVLPLADGGDGSVDAAVAAGARRVSVDVAGPTGVPHTASIAFDGVTATVEVANTCGLALLPGARLDPLGSSSAGFGMAIRQAVRLGPARIVLALGGSASTDGGLGMLLALGADARDADGRPVPGTGHGLLALHRLHLGALADGLGCEVIVATDVEAPLFGARGAAHVFGPQKGADARTVERLDGGLRRLAALTRSLLPPGSAHEPGTGAAGGLGYAATLLGGRLTGGADFFLDLLDFGSRVDGCDAVLTGEGSFDDQTTHLGKLPAVVARRAAPRPVHVVAGRDRAADRHAVDHLFASVRDIASMTDADTLTDPELTASLLTTAARSIVVEVRATT